MSFLAEKDPTFLMLVFYVTKCNTFNLNRTVYHNVRNRTDNISIFSVSEYMYDLEK